MLPQKAVKLNTIFFWCHRTRNCLSILGYVPLSNKAMISNVTAGHIETIVLKWVENFWDENKSRSESNQCDTLKYTWPFCFETDDLKSHEGVALCTVVLLAHLSYPWQSSLSQYEVRDWSRRCFKGVHRKQNRAPQINAKCLE